MYVKITDKDGKPIDENNRLPVQLAGNVLQESKTEDDAENGKITFSAPVSVIEIYNVDENNGVFTVNGIAINVPKGASLKAQVAGSPSAEVEISGATTYIINRYE